RRNPRRVRPARDVDVSPGARAWRQADSHRSVGHLALAARRRKGCGDALDRGDDRGVRCRRHGDHRVEHEGAGRRHDVGRQWRTSMSMRTWTKTGGMRIALGALVVSVASIAWTLVHALRVEALPASPPATFASLETISRNAQR